jgi:hypothetical protein
MSPLTAIAILSTIAVCMMAWLVVDHIIAVRQFERETRG